MAKWRGLSTRRNCSQIRFPAWSKRFYPWQKILKRPKPKLKLLIHVFVSITQNNRFNNPIFKLDNFGVVLFVSFSYKKLLQCSFYENLKNLIKNSNKFVYYNENMYTNFKRNYLENYNDSEGTVKTKNTPFFMKFPNINKNGNFFPSTLKENWQTTISIGNPSSNLLLRSIKNFLCERVFSSLSHRCFRFHR
jgi:hypothetical protein